MQRLSDLRAKLSGQAAARRFWRITRKGFPVLLEMPQKPGQRPNYSSDFLYTLVSDRPRMDAFEKAIQSHKAKSVLEVGCGPWAPLVKMALKSGATKVVAVEANEMHAEMARRSVDKASVTILQGLFSEVELPPKETFQPEVVVGELLGYLASEEGAPAIFADVQDRCGPVKIVPRRASSLLAPTAPLQLSLRDRVRNWLAHGWWPKLRPGHLYDIRNFPKSLELAPAQEWEAYDFESPTLRDSLVQRRSLVFDELPAKSEVGGLLLWMRTDLAEGVDALDTREDDTSWNLYYLHLEPCRVPESGSFAVKTFVDASKEDVVYRIEAGETVYE